MRERGYSMVELMVAFMLLVLVGSVAGKLIFSGYRVYFQESTRQVSNGQARLALDTAVRRLRDNAARVARVNLSLNDAGGKAAVRDGFLVWSDSQHRTVYRDAGGDGFPDQVGWDDADGDGHTDLIGFALVPQDDDHNGVQDFVDADNNKVADNIVKVGGVTDSSADLRFDLVFATFGSLAKALDYREWADARVLAKDVVPQISTVNNVTQYDTIQVQGVHPDNYDYGHDADWDVVDAGDGDGIVDEIEIGQAESLDQLIDTQAEYDIIGSVRFSVTAAKVFERKRLDMGTSVSLVTPRAFAIIAGYNLKYPNATP